MCHTRNWSGPHQGVLCVTLGTGLVLIRSVVCHTRNWSGPHKECCIMCC